MRSLGMLVMVLLVALAGCAPATPSARDAGGGPQASRQAPTKIVATIRGDPRVVSETVNAASGGNTAGVRELDQLVNAGLGLVDKDGRVRPQLAEVVPTLENGLWKLFPDGRMETTWKLRQGAIWHDGAPFTAADLLFTARVGQDRDLAIVRTPAFDAVESLDAPDPHTLVVGWKRPFVDADVLFTQRSSTTITPLPRHILERPYTEDKASFLNQPFWSQGYVGTGPYKLRSWTIGANLVLDANDSYVLGRPKVDTIEVRFLLDTNVVVANLLSGEVQLTLGRGLTVEQAILARQQWRDGSVDTPLIQYTAIWPQFINPDPSVMLDLRFRRALYHALDRQQMADTFLGGLVPVANSVVNPDMPEFTLSEGQALKYPYDPRRAIQLLEEIASLNKGADGFYQEGATGRKISVEINTRTHDLREKLMPVMADMWSRVGVAGDPLVVPEQLADDPAVRAEFRSFRFQFNPVDLNRYHSESTPLAENRYRGNNYSRYRSPELDALIDRYNVTIPAEERYGVVAQVIRHMTENLNVMPLFHDSEPVMISNRLVTLEGAAGSHCRRGTLTSGT